MWGDVAQDSGTISTFIGRDERDRKRHTVHEDDEKGRVGSDPLRGNRADVLYHFGEMQLGNRAHPPNKGTHAALRASAF
ncbi:MAG: hypothetical protein R2795_18935 [Saprospiraceae bacterium]